MATVGIVHHTASGYTALLAHAVAEGVAREDVAPVSIQIQSSDVIEGRYQNDDTMAALDGCDAIIFGTPTHMGSVSASVKAFLDATLSRWYERAWSGKVAAAFTVSSTPSGDKLNALTDLVTFAMQHGMIWVGLDESPINAENANRLGFYLGAAAQPDYTAAEPSLMDGDAETGRRLGARVAKITRSLVSS